MITTTLRATALLPALMAALLMTPVPQMAQEKDGDHSPLSSFVGTWKGICADGKEFVILILEQNGADIGGTVSMANMHGNNGQCEDVLDSPSPEHAAKVRDAQLRGRVLAFKGSQRSEFEMTTVGTGSALLKFLGTPVEDQPWKLKKVR